MTLIKVQHDKDNPYTIINRSIADDSRVSYKAMGLWLYAFSRKEDWQFYLNDLIKRHKDGEESVKSGLKELEKNGYLYRYQRRNEKNQFDGWEWVFFETPKTKEEIQKMFPTTGFSPSRETPNSVKPPPITSNESISNKDNNNKQSVVVSSKDDFFSREDNFTEGCVASGLDKLDLDRQHKIRLLTDHDIETLRIAVSRVLAWKDRKSDAAAIVTVIERKETWIDKPNSSLVKESNDDLLASIKTYDGKVIHGVQIVVGADYVEFSGGTRCDVYNANDAGFKENVVKMFGRLGVNLL